MDEWGVEKIIYSKAKIECEIFKTKTKKLEKSYKDYNNLFKKLVRKTKIIII